MPETSHTAAALAGVDVGGTFTDVVIVDGDGPRIGKVPTTPGDESRAVAQGLAVVGSRRAADGASDPGPARLAHGTTTATNAVLERALARTVLVTTEGFADLLAIARQDRPSLYDLAVVRPPHLVAAGDVVTVAQRTGADGGSIVALTTEEVARVIDAVARRAPESVAVSLLFSYAAPADEEALCAALADRLGVPVTRSSALAPEFREYERTSTAVLNAAVAPVMRRYLSRLADRLPRTAITVMTSGGGTAALPAAVDAPVRTLLSGPAAGVVAAAATARAAGFTDAVAFDMGGTSTDVCLIIDGRPHLSAEGEIGGLPFRTPTVGIHTVGAGGGSIAWMDAGGALRVGPRSAGARPGPACYGHGGTAPTVTDAHCAAGHLAQGAELGEGAVRLDARAARAALSTLPAELGGVDASAEGVLAVARATMARALRRVTTERGVDPRGLALVAYGGAGPLHATTLARELRCAAVIIPPAPGVLSALGLLLAPPRAEAARTVMARLDGAQDLDTAWAALAQEAHSALIAQGVADPVLRRFADCRYTGQSHELRIPAPPEGDLATAFAAAHEAAYGYAMPAEPVHAVTLRVVAEGVPVLAAPPIPEPTVRGPGPARTPTREILLEGARVHAAVVQRCDLRPGDVVTGPAIIDQDDATTLLAHGERGAVDDAGNLVVRWDDEPDRSAGAGAVPDPPASAAGVDGDPVDPVGLEVLRHALQGVAEEMGIALRRAAYSPNIKERADCSAAVFGPDGELVAQAEHIPVHLGSMPASVRAALDAFGGGLEPGMQVAVNDPYAGGTHLPDLTIVSCVGGTTGLLGYVANRAHHADVGGAAPGSMPAAATDIAMEGLRVPPVLIATAKGPRTDVCELIAANSRTPAERHGDLRAQLAANHVGAVRLTELAKRFGRDGLHAAMGAVRDYGDRRVRAAIARIPDGTYRFADQLEVGPDGLRIAVAVTVDGERVIADFAGSAPQVPVNCNAVLAVTQSAAAFVLRMLTDPDAPANEGTTRSLEVRAPAGSVVHATFPAPVAAGNVETSQRIVDVLLGAFAQALPDVVPAASQGTMNNVLLGAGPGAPPYSYYETIAGGEGGTPSRPGMSGVHTGMTNTRNTPAEAMELAYPLRVWRAELRHGTGGQGRHPGGEGVVREIEVLLPSILTLQTERRTSRPWGLAGGGDGAVGRNLRIDAGGAEQPLAAKGTWALEAGERVRIETPGGGGWGTPPEHDDGRASG